MTKIFPEPVKRNGVGKNEWKELVGINGQIAAVIIQRENPTVRAIVVPPGTGMQQNLRRDRVWVMVDSNQLVFCPPHIG